MPLWLIVVLLVLLLGGGGWGWRSGYYGPGVFGGGVGFLVLVIVILWAMGRL